MSSEKRLQESLARIPGEVARMNELVKWKRPNAKTMLWIEWAWQHGYADGLEDIGEVCDVCGNPFDGPPGCPSCGADTDPPGAEAEGA